MEFYGETCPHCIAMKPKVERLEKELGIEIEKREVWNDPSNAEAMKELDKGMCGGVPFFINTESNQFICGATDYKTLKAWAEGEEV